MILETTSGLLKYKSALVLNSILTSQIQNDMYVPYISALVSNSRLTFQIHILLHYLGGSSTLDSYSQATVIFKLPGRHFAAVCDGHFQAAGSPLLLGTFMTGIFKPGSS